LTFDRFLQDACPPLDLEWRKYRRRSARHRVDARLRELGIDNYFDYLAIVRSDAREAELLPDLMRVTVSRFFRDEKEWRALKDLIFPGVMAASSGSGMFRVWSAGCCGGEEPFSLTLLWLEYMLPLHPDWSLEILATDIDEASIERARRATYRLESLREVPADIRNRWFSREKSLWHLDEKARALVRFEKGNLIADPPPTKIDLVLCRYLVFTYYTGERLLAAARRLRDSLHQGGVLMVGAKEVVPAPVLELFDPVPGTRVFYRRKG
jgi:chemotaxis protein methyltransferase CheR